MSIQQKGWDLFVATAVVLSLTGVPVAGTAEELMGDAERGKKVVTEEIECIGCHTIDHKETGKKPVGPDLTMVGTRRSKEWLTTFLKDPGKIVEGSKMPVFDWTSDQELADVIAYLISLNKPVDKSGSGKALVKQYDCQACHKIGDTSQGGLEGPAWRWRYPDLTHIGGKLNREWMKVWLKDPQKVSPGTYMPNFNLSDREIGAIVEYLSSLK